MDGYLGSIAPSCFESAEEGRHAAGVEFRLPSLRVEQLEEPGMFFANLIWPERVDQAGEDLRTLPAVPSCCRIYDVIGAGRHSSIASAQVEARRRSRSATSDHRSQAFTSKPVRRGWDCRWGGSYSSKPG